ncbi:phage tail tape measure protein [Ignavigranum ruoffiae]|uniref:phage tail tape measure protein n=1 Tax=Ignavigranum ruoffiae TaxID=89093 RepID=UPI002352F617|nr:phage tail tape measure protein [Ignavigranum ruoffiae]
MGSPFGKLVVELDFDGSRFTAGMNSAKREMAAYNKATRTSTKYAKDMGYTHEATAIALNNLRTSYKGANEMILKHEKAMANLMRTQGDGWEDEYQRRESQILGLKNNMYDMAKAYQEIQKQNAIAESKFTKFGKSVNTLGSVLVNAGDGITRFGDGLTQMGAMATAGGAFFAKSAIDFEKGMINVQKTTNASSQQMAEFEKEIRNMATTMPIAHEELTQLASIAGQLGVKQNDIAKFTKTMAMLGTATSLSATEASESFARFTNITGTGVSTLDNLGSALVDLGNNMATTETEIMSMAQQLAGTLTTVGVGEADILGLSASMSSLGITAERGASAVSKFFVDMNSAVSEGGQSLQQFADVAGMSSEQFANLFNQDSMGAFQAFIDGLADIEANGGDVIKTLDDMGITEVRLRDTLLRLAQGHDVLAQGIRISNEAYKDGTKHLSEYELMAQSTASQWEIAKNKFKDVAITLGQSLLPAIIDVLNQSDGLIDMVQGAVKWFTNLDEGLKRNIVKWSAMALAFGPIISGIGKFVSAGGMLLKVIGALSLGIGKLAGFKKFADITQDVATSTLAGSKNLNLLQLGLSALKSPLGLTVIGLGAVGIALSNLNRDAILAREAMEDFPTIEGITAEQADSLRRVQDSLTEINTTAGLLSQGVNLKGFTDSVGDLASEIERINNDKIKQLQEDFSKLPQAVQESLASTMEKTIANINQQTEEAKKAVKEINRLTVEGMDENGVLQEGYLQQIQMLTDGLMMNYAEALGETAEQTKQIYDSLTADITEMTSAQIGKRLDFLQDALVEEESIYNQQLDLYKQMLDNKGISESEYNDLVYQAKVAHQSRMKALEDEMIVSTIEGWKKAREEAGKPWDETEYQAFLQEIADSTGRTVEEINQLLKGIDTSEPAKNMILATDNATDHLRQTAIKWGSLMTDFATNINKPLSEITFDDVIANADTFVDSIMQAGITWNDLELLKKEGKMDADTATFLQKVMEGQQVWTAMNLEEKMAYFGVDQEGVAQLKEITGKLGIEWNELDLRVHELMVEGYGAHNALRIAIEEMTDWNNVPLEEKKLMVDGSIANEEVRRAIQTKELWNDTDFIDQYLNIITNSKDAEADINSLLETYGIIPDGQSKTLKTDTNAPETQGILGALLGFWLVKLLGLGTANLNTSTNAEETQGKVTSLGETADSVGQKTPNIETSTNASETEAEMASAEDQAISLDGQNPQIPVDAIDHFSNVFSSAWGEHRRINGYTSHSYHVTHYSTRGRRLKTGTNYHYGGLAVLGDGGKREPFLTPQGVFGLSPNKDTVYDLPIGTKVWSSIAKFKAEASNNAILKRLAKQLPQFAKGTDKSFLDDLKISVPKDFGKNTENTEYSNNVNMEINLQVVGSSLTRTQADSIIEPLIEAGERYSRKRGRRFNNININTGGID